MVKKLNKKYKLKKEIESKRNLLAIYNMVEILRKEELELLKDEIEERLK